MGCLANLQGGEWREHAYEKSANLWGVVPYRRGASKREEERRMTTHALPSGSDGANTLQSLNHLKAETTTRPTIRLHIWLESQGELYFGIGRAQLLYNIQSYGSIKKAAQNMGMSYRAAWGKIQQSEQALGVKLVEHRGAKREGVRLTREGEEIADMFLAWFTAVERCALSSADSIFPFQVTGFEQADI